MQISLNYEDLVLFRQAPLVGRVWTRTLQGWSSTSSHLSRSITTADLGGDITTTALYASQRRRNHHPFVMSNNLLSYVGWTFLPNVRDPEYAHLSFCLVHQNVAACELLYSAEDSVLICEQLVTGWVQSIYYGITIRAGDPKPQPGSPRYLKHRRRIHILVVFTYLLYTIVEADYEIRRGRNFYQDLGLSPDVNDKAIKSRFRRLYVLAPAYHPQRRVL